MTGPLEAQVISISNGGSAILRIGDLIPTGDPGAPYKRNSAWGSETAVIYGKSPFFMGKSTISMAIFNSYVSLPEGKTL